MMTGYYLATGEIRIVSVVIAALIAFITARYGLLSLVVAQWMFLMTFHGLLFTSASWQSIQLLPVVFVLIAAGWAFYTSLGGQSPFSATLLED
jgi:hypothetical protein